MEEIKEVKNNVRNEIADAVTGMDPELLKEKYRIIEERLFDFANFLESTIPLLYMEQGHEVPMLSVIRKSYAYNKVVVLPTFNKEKRAVSLMKVDNFDTDLTPGPRGVSEPDPEKCKKVPLQKVDIAIIPGIAFDEKGGRIGSGMGYYDRLIPKLSATARKVSLCLECQLIPQVPMESHDRHVDIIITEDRVIYKI